MKGAGAVVDAVGKHPELIAEYVIPPSLISC